MKVERHGLNYEKGIGLTCGCCNCNFIVEDRYDLHARPVYSFDNLKYYEYYTECPECEAEYYIGINPHRCNFRLESSSNIIFDREDWESRFAWEEDK